MSAINIMYGGLANQVIVTNIVGGVFKPRTGDVINVTALPHFKNVPIEDVEFELQVHGEAEERITATRVVAGSLLLGPVGTVAGVLAKKKSHAGTLILRAPGRPAYRHTLNNRKEIEKAARFMEDCQMYRQVPSE